MTTKEVVERMAKAEAKLQGLKWSELTSGRTVLLKDCKRYLTLLRQAGLTVSLKGQRPRTSG